jgi:hypothetical protein
LACRIGLQAAMSKNWARRRQLQGKSLVKTMIVMRGVGEDDLIVISACAEDDLAGVEVCGCRPIETRYGCRARVRQMQGWMAAKIVTVIIVWAVTGEA